MFSKLINYIVFFSQFYQVLYSIVQSITYTSPSHSSMPAEYSSFSLFPVFVWLQMQEILFISFGLDGAMEPNNWTVHWSYMLCDYMLLLYMCAMFIHTEWFLVLAIQNKLAIKTRNAKMKKVCHHQKMERTVGVCILNYNINKKEVSMYSKERKTGWQ